MASFQRARSEEQRDERRRTILATTATMLDELPVAAITLNELSRRSGLAKSAIVRYFESREAVLLELLDAAAQEWLVGVRERFVPDPDRDVGTRVAALAEEIADAFDAAPTLCELLSAQAAVLEHNVSSEVARRHKLASRESLDGFAELVGAALPELGPERAGAAAGMTIVLAGSLWTHTHPPEAVLAVYASEPGLMFVEQDFAAVLAHAVETFLLGLLARG
jgi:AcrR family transcriptional regulator